MASATTETVLAWVAKARGAVSGRPAVAPKPPYRALQELAASDELLAGHEVGGQVDLVHDAFTDAGAMIQSPKSTTEHPFSADGSRPYEHKHVLKLVKKTGELAGTQPTHTRMLRHTFGTQCARRGVPLLTIEEWMGHARRRLLSQATGGRGGNIVGLRCADPTLGHHRARAGTSA